MSASIKKKSKPKSDKVATNNNNNNNNNNKRPFFLPKINKVFLRPILQNLKGRSVLDKFFFENDPLDELNQMPLGKKFYPFRKLVKKRKIVVKIEFTPLSLDRKIFPFKKGFKKMIFIKNKKYVFFIFRSNLIIISPLTCASDTRCLSYHLTFHNDRNEV